jgi:hypothetical protein
VDSFAGRVVVAETEIDGQEAAAAVRAATEGTVTVVATWRHCSDRSGR